MATEIGSAYLTVLPQLGSDFESSLNSDVAAVGDIPVMVLPEISGDANLAGQVGDAAEASSADIEEVGAGIGESLVTGLAATIGTAVAAGGAVFAGLSAIGLHFQKAQAVLRAGTGETGQNLEQLKTIANDIFASSPAALDEISNTVALAHQRLGLVPEDLELVSKRIVQLSRISGTDLPTLTDNVTGMFNLWHVGADQQEGDLDKILRVSQQTGIGVDDLTGQLNGAGLQLQSLGFSFDDSISLIGNLSKSGLDLSVTTAAFRKALTLAAKEGKPANEVFKSIFEQIRDAPDDTTAAGLAVENFGARGVTMAKAIRDGQFAWEDLSDAIQTGDTIPAAAGDVSNFASKFEILKHKAELAFEPIGSGLADALTGFGAFAGDVWTTFQKEGWDAAWDKITDKAGQIWDGDPSTGQEGVHQKLNRFLEGVPGWALEAAGKLGEAGLSLFEASVKWAEGIWNGDPETGREGLSAKLDRAIGAFPGWVVEQGDKVTAAASGLIDSVVSWGDKVWDGDEQHEGLGTKLNRLTDPDGPVVTWITQAPGKLGPVFAGWGDAAVRWVTTLWDGDPETGRQGIHQGFDKLIEDITTWVDEQGGEKMAALGGKLFGAMVLGSLMALQLGWKLLGSWTEFALKAAFLTLIPGLFSLGHSLGRAILRGFVQGFLDGMPGPLKTLLESAPTIGPIIKELELASNWMEGEHAAGGMVGGRTGAAALAIVHGGERVLTAQQNADLGLGTGFAPASSSGDGFTLVQHIAGQEPERTAQKTVTAMREEFLTRGTGR